MWTAFDPTYSKYSTTFLSHQFQRRREMTNSSSPTDVFEELMFFGSFFTMEIELNDFYILDQLHNVLQEVYNGSYDTQTIIDRVTARPLLIPHEDLIADPDGFWPLQLTPDCYQFLNKCSFGANEQNCSDLFAKRRTELGYCCAFNMNRPTQEQFWHGEVYNRSNQLYIKTSGMEVGLSLEINPNLEDITYVAQSNIGFRVYVLEPHNFPTEDLQPIVIEPNMETFLSIVPRRITSDPAMVDITADSRGCYFFQEPKLIYTG